MRALMDHALARQLTKFALVGGVGFVVDVTAFTLLRLTPAFEGSPLKAKIISTVLAAFVDFLVASIVLVGLMLYHGFHPPLAALAYLPAIVLVQVTLTNDGPFTVMVER